MSKGIQIMAHNSLMKLKVGASLPVDKEDEKQLKEKVMNFYRDLYRILSKDYHLVPDHKEAHYLRMSFEDDFEEEDDLNDNVLEEEDIFDEDDMLDADVVFDEENVFNEEIEGDEREYFFNK